MPTLEEARRVIEEVVQDNWTLTPIAWENVPPKDYGKAGQPLLTEGSDNFILVDVEFWDSQAITVPIDCIRYFGAVSFDIYIREDTGTREASKYKDALIGLFNFKTYSGVRLKDYTSVGTFQMTEGWITTTVQFEFEFERQW